MIQFIFKHLKTVLITGVLITMSSVFLYASSTGFTGRTQKTSNLGCGSCHGNNPVPETTVSIIGPDTVNAGQTTMFFLIITKPSKTGAGFDLATRQGTLSPVSSNTHLSNGELTQSINIPMTNGTVTIQFNYTAPNSPTIDTIWATGNATNSDGTSSGDNWNWAPSKRVFVRNLLGVPKTSGGVPDKFSLEQNFPNPFNPSTSINFSVPFSSVVKLRVFDLTGRSVETLINSSVDAGAYRINWNAANYPSGVYFYKLESAGFSETKKMILVK